MFAHVHSEGKGYFAHGGNWMELVNKDTNGVLGFTGALKEQVKITAGKLSDNTNIDLENGMVHYFTTQETTTSTPNIRFSSSVSLDSIMAVGETISVTIITTAAAAAATAPTTTAAAAAASAAAAAFVFAASFSAAAIPATVTSAAAAAASAAATAAAVAAAAALT